MKHWASLVALVMVLLLVACGAQYRTIVVDEVHIGFSRPDSSEPPPYWIEPSGGVIVVSSDYNFPIAKEFGLAGPNSIHVVKGQNEKYKAPWKGVGVAHELSATTLTPLAGSVPFRGFAAGETAMIAIGFDHTGVTPGKENVLSAMWLGMVKVK